MANLLIKFSIVLSGLIALACCQTAGFNSSYTYVSFDTLALSNFQLNGDAAAFNGNTAFNTFRNGRLALCRNMTYAAGSAYLQSSISLSSSASFSTAFAFQITDSGGIQDNDGIGADGIVFSINSKTNVLGSNGQGIGYSGLTNSVGIEFDTYDNGASIDIDGNHVGINVNGAQKSTVSKNVPTRMNNGNVYYAWVDFDGTKKIVEARINTVNVRPSAAFVSLSLDLVNILGSSKVYVGFSSATGGGYGMHFINSWTFNNYYAPIQNISTPITSGALTTNKVTSASITSSALTSQAISSASISTNALSTGSVTSQAITSSALTTGAVVPNRCANVTCVSLGQCYSVGVCNPSTGICSNPVNNGITCDDGSVCSTADKCYGGQCIGTAVSPCYPYILLTTATGSIVATQSVWLPLNFKGLMNITAFHVSIVNYPVYTSDVDDGTYNYTHVKYPSNGRDYSMPNKFDGLMAGDTDFVALKFIPAQTITKISSYTLKIQVDYTLANGVSGSNQHNVLIPVTAVSTAFNILNSAIPKVAPGSSTWFAISITALNRLDDFKATFSSSSLQFTYPNGQQYSSFNDSDYLNVGDTDFFSIMVTVPDRINLGYVYPYMTVSWSNGASTTTQVLGLALQVANILKRDEIARDTSDDLSLTSPVIAVTAGVSSFELITIKAGASAITAVQVSVESDAGVIIEYGSLDNYAYVGSISAGESLFGAVRIEATEGVHSAVVTVQYVKDGNQLSFTQTITIDAQVPAVTISTTQVELNAGESSIQSISYSSQNAIASFVADVSALDGWTIETISTASAQQDGDSWFALLKITTPSSAVGDYILPVNVDTNKRQSTSSSYPLVVSVKPAQSTPGTPNSPSPTSLVPSAGSKGREGFSVGASVGIAVGCVAAVAAIAAAGIIIRKRRGQNKINPFRFRSDATKKAEQAQPVVLFNTAAHV